MKKHTHVWILQTCVFSTSHTFVFGMCLVKATYVWFVPLHKNANRQCFFSHMCVFTHVGIFDENKIVFFHTCLAFYKYVQNKPNMCVNQHTYAFWQMVGFYPSCMENTKHVGIFTPGCFFRTCLDFDTYMCTREKAHMCGKSHTIKCLQMFDIFHTCVGKATDMLISL